MSDRPSCQGSEETHREGEHYKTIDLYGKSFELYYGYYEDCDRQNPLCEPIPVYPDFAASPVYTDEGYPFATDMQDPCQHFEGKRGGETCYECKHYEHGIEFLGVCRCEQMRKNE
ncbi:MAG: hypothetical protein IJY42_06700 [Clostridia bacterium]|nr:hypothetical protein [Clostridia bacterium]